ncbi:MAG TPA: amidohydrolase family protein [Solirubrobacteraceae bacterium]
MSGVVDAHVHVIPPGVDAPPVPPSVVGEIADVDRILEQTGADAVILSPWVALLDRDVSEAMAGLVSDRVAALGAATTADGLRAAMSLGLSGVEITAQAPLGADRFEPFWAAAEETGALVFVHPSTRGFTGPDEYHLWNTVGNPLETTVAAAHLVMAGVLERHPDLRVLLAHGGGALPWLRGRLRHAHEHLAAAGTRLREPVEASLRRLHYDTITHDPGLLRALAEFAGAERLVLGSDHPFDMADPDPVATATAAGLDPAVLGANAERLLR